MGENGFSTPSESDRSEVSAVSISPTSAVPVMARAPVAGLFGYGAAATTSVTALVSFSRLPASSVKLTRTWMYRPRSIATRV